jgi:microcystin-dependent protein
MQGIFEMDPFIGEIRLFGFPRVPDGWLACIGQAVPISQYDVLYAVIGTTYGGDGVQTFNLPDLRGRVPIGQGAGPGLPAYAIGQLAGEELHTLVETEMPTHSHALLSSTATATTATPALTVHLATSSSGNLYAPVMNAAPYATMAACVTTAGKSIGHNNMMPTVVANYCISTVGIFPASG